MYTVRIPRMLCLLLGRGSEKRGSTDGRRGRGTLRSDWLSVCHANAVLYIHDTTSVYNVLTLTSLPVIHKNPLSLPLTFLLPNTLQCNRCSRHVENLKEALLHFFPLLQATIPNIAYDGYYLRNIPPPPPTSILHFFQQNTLSHAHTAPLIRASLV